MSKSKNQEGSQNRILLQRKTTMFQPQKTKLEKKFDTLKKPLEIYEIYIKALLGFEIEEDEDLNYNFILMNYKKELYKSIEVFPDCVITLLNPDYRDKDSIQNQRIIQSSLELFELIKSGLRINQKSLDDQLLLKAVESIYLTLPEPTELFTEIDQEQKNIRDPQHLNLLGERSEMKYNNIDKQEMIKNFVQQLENQFKQFLTKDPNGNILDCLILNYKELKNTSLRRWKYGQFLDQQNDIWVRTGIATADVQTLMRLALIIKFNKIGFNITSFLSENGSKIYLLLDIQDSNLKVIADKSHVLKQLNFWFTDLFSLEPVDKSYRPLRINNRIWKPQDFVCSDLFLYLRPQMQDLIKKINFKRIARETNQSSINSQLFEYGTLDFSEKDNGPSDEEWIAYHKYLTHLEKLVRQFRGNQLIDNDMAALLNNDVTALQIYQKKNAGNKEIQNLNNQNVLEPQNYEHYEQLLCIQAQADRMQNEFSNFQFSLKLPIVKAIKLLKKEAVSLNYLHSFQESLRVANGEQIRLFNLWERSSVPPSDMYHPYSMPFKNNTKTNKAKQELNWRKYVKNENNDISLFSSHERLKLVYQNISQEIEISMLYQLGLLRQIFCLNDHYELFGQCGNIQAQITLDTRFFKKKPFQLIDDWKLDYFHPWITPCDLICGYYGEKIGLYFYFMSYFTEMTTPIAVLGFTSSIIQWIIWDNESDLYILVTIVFSFILIQWSNIFTDLWKQKQIYFNLRYGQSNQTEEQVQRSKFQGKHIRSLVNDQLNSIEVLYKEYLKRTIISSSILFIYILFYIGIVVALFVFTVQLHDQYQEELKKFDVATIEVTAAAALNFIAQQVIDKIFNFVAAILTDYENYKTVEAYETSFVLKKFIFSFFSYIAPLLFLDYLNKPLNLYCSQTNCERHVKYYFSAIVMLILMKQIIQFVFFLMNLKKFQIKYYDYNEIDVQNFVEEQSERQPYSQDIERYGTMQDYMELFVLISFLSIFGYSFPFSFFILWISNIMQIQVKKNTFLYIIQRPWPKNESSLGIWNNFLEIISLLCLLTNTGVITVQYNKKYGYELILVFLSILIFNCVGKFIIGVTLGQVPEVLNDLMKRHKYLIKATIQNKIKEGKSSENKEILQRFPIVKVYGTLNSAESGRFETISSDDELKDHYEIPDAQKKLGALKIELNYKNLDKKFGGEFQFSKVMECFESREQNWAFQCKFQNDTEKKKIRKYQKIYNLLYKAKILSQYQVFWTDLRYSQRYFYMKRKLLAIRNLDNRRYSMISQKLQQMKTYFSEKAQQKFRKDFQLLGKLEDINKQEHPGYLALMKKQQNYVDKHTWINTRKVVVFKLKALVIRGFRKQVIKKPSIKLIQEFYKISQIIEDLVPDNPLQESLDEQVDYSQIDKITMHDFIDIFSKIDLKSSNQYYLPLSSKRSDPQNYFIEDQKSNEFTNIFQLSKDSSMFQKQQTALQDIILQYFQEEQFPIPTIRFLKHFHDNIWLVQLSDQEQHYLLQFIQFKHGETYNFQKFLNKQEGIFYDESANYLRLANLVDQIDDFYIKGYSICLFQTSEPRSLYQVLKYRKTYGIPYIEQELKQFLFACLNLLKLNDYQSLSGRNIFLVKGEYRILNASQNHCSLWELGKILLEMIYLEEIKNDEIKLYFDKLQHPIKWILNELLFMDDNLQKLLDFIQQQYCFRDIMFEIEQKLSQSQITYSQSYQNFTWSTLHKINLCFRMKQFKEALNYVKEFEKYVSQEVFDIKENLFLHFNKEILEDLNFYLLSSHGMKRYVDLILIYYYQICCRFQQKQNIAGQLQIIIDTLKSLSTELRLIIKQLVSNINVANLNQTEQCIILQANQFSDVDFSQLLSKSRQQLLAQLRKNQNLIGNIQLFEKQINRFLNQFYAVFTLQSYYSEQYEFAKLSILTVLDAQQQIIKQEKLPEILSEAQELSPSQFNFNQLSPGMEREDQEIVHFDEYTFDIQKEIEENPLYATQYLFYEFLQVLILHDCKNELFKFKIKNFINFNFKNSPSYLFYQQIAITLQNNYKISDVDKQYLKLESECVVGKYIVLQLKKNIEFKLYEQSELVPSDDLEFNWKQVFSYTNLKCSAQNKSCLLFILQQKTQNLEMKALLDIRIIHFLLSIYDYCPFYFNKKIRNFNKEQLGGVQFEQNSKILMLQNLHQKQQYKITSDYFSSKNDNQDLSWIYHSGLLYLRIFIFQSYCYCYSKKHYENLTASYNTQEEVFSQISSIIGKGDVLYSIAKNFQILQLPMENVLVNVQTDYFLYHQYLLIYLKVCLNQKHKLIDIFNKLEPYLTEMFKGSVFMLGIVQIYHEMQEYDMVSLMMQFIRRLIDYNAHIVLNAHEGFEKDFQILEATYKQRKQFLIKSPNNKLFLRSEYLDFFENEILNSRYILFNLLYHSQLKYSYSVLEDFLLGNQNKLPKTLEQMLKTAQCYLKGQTGDEEILILAKQVQEYKFAEGSLTWAFYCHIMCRYYISMLDYEKAKQFSILVMSYLFTIDVLEGFYLKENKSGYRNNFECLLSDKNIIKKVCTPQQIQIQEIADDAYFENILDEYFVLECILNHLEILSKDLSELPKLHVILQFQLKLQSPKQRIYFWNIFSNILFKIASTGQVVSILQAFKEEKKVAVQQLKEMRQLYKKKKNAKILLREITMQEIEEFEYLQNLIVFQLQIYKLDENSNEKIFYLFSIQSAERSIVGYSNQYKDKSLCNKHSIAQLKVLLCQNYSALNQFGTAIFFINEAEDCFVEWFGKQRHPIKGVYYYYFQELKRSLYEEIILVLENLIEENQMNLIELKLIVQGLAGMKINLWKVVEMFRANQIDSLVPYFKEYIQEIGDNSVFDMAKGTYQKSDAKIILDGVLQSQAMYDLSGTTELIDAENMLRHFEQDNFFVSKISAKLFKIQNENLMQQVYIE